MKWNELKKLKELSGLIRIGNRFKTIGTTLDIGNKPTIRVYTSDSTWSKPATLNYVLVEIAGGGGGGGGGAGGGAGGGGGGGGGGYSRKYITASDLNATETVTI